jgi:tetratricopeptide (TPR) repeat protein
MRRLSILLVVFGLCCAASPQVSVSDELEKKRFGEEIASLETKVAANPNDLKCREEFLQTLTIAALTDADYPELKKKRREQLLWLVKNHPDSSILNASGDLQGSSGPLEDIEGREAARKLWLEQVEANEKNAPVLKHAALFFQSIDPDRSERLIFRAIELNPETADAISVMALHYTLEGRAATSEVEKHQQALKAFRLLEHASSVTSGETHFDIMIHLTQAAFDAGELSKAQEYSQALLQEAPRYSAVPSDPSCPSSSTQPNYNYGNALHSANIVLGEVALARGDMKEADRFLLEAGRTPGSAQLASFGPNMMLARMMLEKGESKVVLEYFAECKKFWEYHEGKLDDWTQKILKGEVPDFGGNLLH